MFSQPRCCRLLGADQSSLPLQRDWPYFHAAKLQLPDDCLKLAVQQHAYPSQSGHKVGPEWMEAVLFKDVCLDGLKKIPARPATRTTDRRERSLGERLSEEVCLLC